MTPQDRWNKLKELILEEIKDIEAKNAPPFRWESDWYIEMKTIQRICQNSIKVVE